MPQFISIASKNAIARVTLNRTELHNAFNDAMITELVEAFTQLGSDQNVRVIILAANGKSFCAGADLNWMKKMIDYSFEQNVVDALGLAKMLKIIHDCPKPVIARVHGAAFGGGVGLIAACDFAFSVASATFALTEVKLGLLPAVISPFVLKKIPASAAQRYFLTAEKFDATEAQRIGLISEIAEDEAALDQKLDACIETILANGPEAVAQAKVLINNVLAFHWDEAMALTSEMIAGRRVSAEGQEGMKSFLEKRKPNWLLEAQK